MRIYRACQRLYPSAFRDEYGAEMLAVFAREWRDAGRGRRIRLAFAAVPEIVGNAALVHWDILRQDVRAACRFFGRRPGFAALAVLVTAVGIGANAAVFSVADFAFFQPLPYPDEQRLVRIWESRPGYPRMELSPANYRDWQARVTTVEAIAPFRLVSANVVDIGEPQRLDGAAVAAAVFDALGVPASLGRTFTSGDEILSAPDVVVIGHALWVGQFGGAHAVIGRTIRLDDRPHQIVGVMPAAFAFPRREIAYWVPLRMPPGMLVERTNNMLYAIARLKSGATTEQLAGELAIITTDLERQYPRENSGTRAAIHPLRSDLAGQSRTLLLSLVGARCTMPISCAASSAWAI